MAGVGGGGGAHRVDAQLLGELVQLLATQGVVGCDLLHGAARLSDRDHSLDRNPRSLGDLVGNADLELHLAQACRAASAA